MVAAVVDTTAVREVLAALLVVAAGKSLPDVVRKLVSLGSMTLGHTGSSVIRGWLYIIS